jgi:hypothetical protein
MYVDDQLVLSDTQTVTATAVGTNVIDLGVARSIGNGEPMAVVFAIESDAVQTGSDEDYTFEVEYSSVAAQTSGYITIGRRLYESGTPAAPAQNADLLVTGYKFVIPIPPTGEGDDERYLGVRYTIAGAAADVDVTAYVTPMSMIDASVDYADGFTIA